ncbi:hypothetical protein BKA70DRAFT_1461623 [Coprinopsis sp. MPI-PUGE-AT-0042]|nr:hypothetical protein BKA70DRAFT_1461623 [Coprinopsis sp. MPI-PUGE-AT-0042]
MAEYSLASKVKNVIVPSSRIPWQPSPHTRAGPAQSQLEMPSQRLLQVGSLPGNFSKGVALFPDEKHPSWKTQLESSKQAERVNVVWSISSSIVASMVLLQLPSVSILLTSMDYLTRSAVRVGSPSGQESRVRRRLNPQERLHHADTHLSYFTFLLVWIRYPLRNI